jgi:hypothetical protein
MASSTAGNEIITNLKTLFQELVVENIEGIREAIIEFGPNIILALATLFMGWVFAVLLKKVTSKLLKAVGSDVWAEKMGLKDFLLKSGMDKNPSHIAGLIIYWIVLFKALAMAFDTVGMEGSALFIKQVFFYLPTIAMVMIVLALGRFLGRVVGRFTETSAKLARLPGHVCMGRIAQYAIVAIIIILTLKHLGAREELLAQCATILFMIVPVIASVMFLLGGRDIVSNVLAGRCLIREYKPGDRIVFDSVSGEILSIDLVTTRIKGKDAELVVPNSMITAKIVKKIEI